MKGKCPHCDHTITEVRISPVPGKAENGSGWKCVTYNCPSCRAVLSAQIDPVAIHESLLSEIKKRR